MVSLNLIYFVAFVGSCSVGEAIYNWTTPAIGSGTGRGSLNIAEDEILDIRILTLEANGALPIIYIQLTRESPFDVTSDGFLSLSKPLDYEKETSHVISVKAIDHNQTTGTATITIMVTDVNEAPTFNEDSYSECIINGTKAGTTVANVYATDEDTNDFVSHKITGGNSNSLFTINERTGEIKVSEGMVVDVSSGRSYKLVVTASDGSFTATVTVSITVEDRSCYMYSGVATVVVSSVTILVTLLSTQFLDFATT